MSKFLTMWKLWALVSARPISKSDLAGQGIDFNQVRPILVALYRAQLIGFDRDQELFLPPGYQQIREQILAKANGEATLVALESAAGGPIKHWLDHFVGNGVLTLDQASQSYQVVDLGIFKS